MTGGGRSPIRLIKHGDVSRAIGAYARQALAPPCACGHAKQAHEHYRRGSDCALCGCRRFHRPLSSWLRNPIG